MPSFPLFVNSVLGVSRNTHLNGNLRSLTANSYKCSLTMSRRKQAKPRSVKGRDYALKTKEDIVQMGRKHCAGERSKEMEGENDRQETNERSKDKTSTQPSGSPSNDSACSNVEEEDSFYTAFPAHSSPLQNDKCCLGLKRERGRDLQRLCQCWKVKTSLLSNSSVPLEISHLNHQSKSQQCSYKQAEEGRSMFLQHFSAFNNLPNNMEDSDSQQRPQDDSSLLKEECSCVDSKIHIPVLFGIRDVVKPMASAEKRKSPFEDCLGISKKLKCFNKTRHTFRGFPLTKLDDNKITSSPTNLTLLSEQHKNEMNVSHSMLLEATITAAIQRVLQCSFCPTSFLDLEALLEHIHQSHNINLTESKVFFCSQCFCGFLTKDSLDDHMQCTHNKKQNLKLDPDQEETTESNSLQFCPLCMHVPDFKSQLNMMNDTKKTYKDNLINPCKVMKKSALAAPQLIKITAKRNEQVSLPSSDLICDHCGAKYSSLDLFQTHLNSHLSRTPSKLPCRELLKDSPNEKSFKKHTMSYFDKQTAMLYICESCCKTFTAVKDLEGHLLEMHTVVSHRCSLCQQVFNSKMSVQVHLATEHSNKRTMFQCTACDWTFHQEQELHLHVKQKHLDNQFKKFSCIFCTESFSTDVELQCHITTHTNRRDPYVCNKTTSPLEVPLHKKFQAKSQSVEGNNVTSPPVSQPSAKDSSGWLPVNSDTREGMLESIFGSPTAIKGKVNLNDPMFACEICGASYTMQVLLTNHQVRDHHILPGEHGTLKRKVEAIQGSHKCKDCSKTFFTEMALWEHVQTHLGPTKLCQCPICGERFPSLLTLTEHKVTHSRSLDTGNCRICKLPLHSEEDFLEHCQKHPDLHNSLTGFRCVVCMQTVTSTLELKIHGTFHMQKVQTEDVSKSSLDHSNLNPDWSISSGNPLQETLDDGLFERTFKDRKAVIAVNCCFATALTAEDFINKNTLTQTTTV